MGQASPLPRQLSPVFSPWAAGTGTSTMPSSGVQEARETNCRKCIRAPGQQDNAATVFCSGSWVLSHLHRPRTKRLELAEPRSLSGLSVWAAKPAFARTPLASSPTASPAGRAHDCPAHAAGSAGRAAAVTSRPPAPSVGRREACFQVLTATKRRCQSGHTIIFFFFN